MWIARQQRTTAGRARRRDRPVVAAQGIAGLLGTGHGERGVFEHAGGAGGCKQRCVRRTGCGNRNPFLARRRASRHRLNGLLDRCVAREERVRGIAAHEGGDACATQVVRVVRQRQCHAHQQVHRVARLPMRHRRRAKQLVLDWRTGRCHGRAVGIHAIGERLHGPTSFAGGIERRPLPLCGPAQAKSPRFLVERQRTRADQFRQRAGRGAIGELHLEEAVTRDRVSQCAICVARVRRIDVRHTARIEQHAHIRAQRRDLLRLAPGQIAVADGGSGTLHRIEQRSEWRNADAADPPCADEHRDSQRDCAADGTDETPCHSCPWLKALEAARTAQTASVSS